MLGNSRCEVVCMDGVTRMAHIRGKLKNKVWIQLSDYVLVGLREFQDDKCDILMKYNADEVRALKSYGELPQDGGLSGETKQDETNEECTFDFDDI